MDPATGEQYEEFEIDSALIQFILKNRKPEVYGDKSKVEHRGTVQIADEEINARGRRLLAEMQALQPNLKGSP